MKFNAVSILNQNTEKRRLYSGFLLTCKHTRIIIKNHFLAQLDTYLILFNEINYES